MRWTSETRLGNCFSHSQQVTEVSFLSFMPPLYSLKCNIHSLGSDIFEVFLCHKCLSLLDLGHLPRRPLWDFLVGLKSSTRENAAQ
jgi:hypothetical protein